MTEPEQQRLVKQPRRPMTGLADLGRTAWRLFSVLMGEVERDASLAARVRAVLHGCRVSSSE